MEPNAELLSLHMERMTLLTQLVTALAANEARQADEIRRRLRDVRRDIADLETRQLTR